VRAPARAGSASGGQHRVEDGSAPAVGNTELDPHPAEIIRSHGVSVVMIAAGLVFEELEPGHRLLARAAQPWDRRFESPSLRRRVSCEPDFLSLAPPRCFTARCAKAPRGEGQGVHADDIAASSRPAPRR